MKCKHHPTQEVVALCSSCNQGVCEECANATFALREDYGILCTTCYESKLKNENKKKVKNIIFNSILYILGIIIFVLAISNGGYSMAVIGIVLCGIHNAITSLKKSKIRNKRAKKSFLKKLIMFFIFAILGVIITPIKILRDTIKLSKNKKLLKKL